MMTAAKCSEICEQLSEVLATSEYAPICSQGCLFTEMLYGMEDSMARTSLFTRWYVIRERVAVSLTLVFELELAGNSLIC